MAAMKRHVRISTEPINEAALQAARMASAGAGAVVYFVGLVRGMEAETAIEGLEYESFQRMVEHQFDLLLDQMEKRWPIECIRLVHRIGFVKVNEASLWLEVIAPHRSEAFAASQWLIDEMKKVVPIWKKPQG